ncbi:MAG: hypothetical protein J0I20_14710 [Chloroflexi bacterium]|nr:hypothetical protein [Chloroflexota bacterium]OJW02751.1 MAG: hypothetical protein BGO39_05860 [Chloroflexi bacterium 54-19]
MQDKFNKEVASTSSDDNLGVTPEFQEALAVYFERLNGPEGSGKVIANSASLDPQVESLLGLPGRLKPRSSDVDSAWMRFKQRSFSPAVVAQENTASLGHYVSQALDQNEASAITESGLSKSTLEAIKADRTSMDELRGYQLNDYANLARQYGVKDSAFPRMLRWLKGLGKSLTLPSFGSSGSMVFAREEEARRQGLSEAELAEHLEQSEKPEQPTEQPENTEKE